MNVLGYYAIKSHPIGDMNFFFISIVFCKGINMTKIKSKFSWGGVSIAKD